MKNLLEEAKALFEKHELPESLNLVNEYLANDKDNVVALLLKARIQYKLQRWGEAMNEYHAVLDIDPDNKEAKSGLEMAKSILGYFTPDMFNP
ncbi:MAG TPA: tetratricopeptide repeat protein [Prolixibacteraceae bacterium]|nr:tetratricopeptide repeat protein [Prolixibacteraceae bacterium]